jgi:tetratricopeptide (TPR) repeat protein
MAVVTEIEETADMRPLPKTNLSEELQQLAAQIQSTQKTDEGVNEETEKIGNLEQLPLFQPYHTVDYFASQGIKLDKIVGNSDDRFGQQLKSFTDWIKTMKRLPKGVVQKKLEGNDDTKVIADAASSLQDKETLTESMAEVYEKQGLFQKAITLYQKLSLLNPDKSHYFAAKIDALKQ